MGIHRSGCAAALTITLLLAGCGPDRERPKTRQVTGTVEKINLETGVVQVRAYSEKHEQEFDAEVRVTDDTEIMINGALVGLDDVRVGETAKGTVRIERTEDDRPLFIALRVQIARQEALIAPDADSNADANTGSTGASQDNGASPDDRDADSSDH